MDWKGIAGVVALGALCWGCAAPPEVIQLYRAPSSSTAPSERLLVINVSSDRQMQAELELAVSRRLRDADVEAVVAHEIFDESDALQQADVDRAADAASADAILMLHIVGLDTTVDVEAGRSDTIFECRGGDPLDYFLYDRETITEPDSVRFAHTVTVVSNLYRAGSGERLWTIQSTCFDKSTMSEVIRDEAAVIVRQLQRDGLI